MSAWKYQQNNELPVSWESTPLNYLFTIIGGNGFAPELQGESDGELPFIKNSDIRSGISKISAAVNYVSRDLAQKEGFNIVPENSILMGKIGESMKKNRRVLNTVECCIDNNMQAMVPHMELIQPEYGLYALQLLDAADFNNGGPVPSINNIKWKRAHIPLPRKREQIRIMAVLDSETAKIDQAIDLLQQELETLEQLKKSVIHEAVTKGLDPTVPMKPSGVNWIGDIPEDWSLARLKDCLTICNGKEVESDSGPIPVYGSGGVFKWTDRPLYVGESLLFGRKGTIDKPLMANDAFWTVDTMFYSIPRNDDVLRYLYYIAIVLDYKYYQTGSTVPSMTQSDLGGFFIPRPNAAIQQAIADYLDSKCETIDKSLAAKRGQIEVLRNHRQSFIYEYVTGKRRVSEVA